jgi:hypothetical protein
MPLKLLFRFVVLLGLTVPAFAAKTEIPPAVAALPPTKAKSGYVQGRVTDSAGKPLAGVMIHIYGTTFAGENTRFERPTGADGRFSQRLPDGIYGVRAEYVFEGEANYTLALHPIDGITAKRHDSEEGIAKDFVWLISGLRPGATPGEPGTHNEPNKYYGGSLQISAYEDSSTPNPPFADGSTLIAELTPRGPLLDGRPVQPLTFRRTFGPSARSTSYWYPSDIPLGRYTLRLSLEKPGQPAKPLTLKQSLDFSGGFKSAVDVDVLPSASTGTPLPIQITVKP